MKIEFPYNVKEEEALENWNAINGKLPNPFGPPSLMFFVVYTGCGYLLLFMLQLYSFSYAYVALCFVIKAWTISVHSRFHKGIRRAVKELTNERMELSEEGVTIISDSGVHNFQWNVFRKLYQGIRIFTVFKKDGSHIVIPKRLLGTDQAIEEIRSYMKASIPENHAPKGKWTA